MKTTVYPQASRRDWSRIRPCVAPKNLRALNPDIASRRSSHVSTLLGNRFNQLIHWDSVCVCVSRVSTSRAMALYGATMERFCSRDYANKSRGTSDSLVRTIESRGARDKYLSTAKPDANGLLNVLSTPHIHAIVVPGVGFRIQPTRYFLLERKSSSWTSIKHKFEVDGFERLVQRNSGMMSTASCWHLSGCEIKPSPT